MDYNGKTHSIKTEQLPRTWSEILSSFSVREIRKFPLEGQALTNARHAIPRMERRGLTFRTRSKDKHLYILCTSAPNGSKLSRTEIRRLFDSIGIQK